MELREHQRKGVEAMHNGCVLNGGVGVGKTITSLAYFVEKECGGKLDRSEPMKTPKTLVVITPAKKRNMGDWQNEALHFGIFTDASTSYSGREMIVDSWNNIGKYKDMKDAFFIFDEQRIPGKGEWVKSFLKIAKSNNWILLSATPADTWMDYVPVFLANGFYRTRSEFIDEHVNWTFTGKYRQIKGFFGVKKLRAFRDQILVDMPFDRHTVRHVIPTKVEFDEKLFDQVWKHRWNVYENEPLIDAAEMHRVGRQVVNSDASRLNQICLLAAKHPRLIIFYSFNYELDALRTLEARLGIPVAEYNGHKHEEIPEGDRWIYLVNYASGAEAWNCITTDSIVYYSLTYSHKVFEQTQGRIDRMNTPYTDLWYHVLISDAKIDRLIWKSLQGKKNFHEGRNVKFTQSQFSKAV